MTGDQDEYANQYFRYTFRIDDLIKGDLKETTVDVYSATQGSMCGVNYNLGTKLLIYSHYSDGYFSTGSCSQNLILENITRPYKKILRKFKRSKKSRKWKNIDGKITAEGKVVKKVAQGAWTYYHEDGTVQSKGSYLNGQLHGEWVYYLSINDSKEHIAALSKEKQAKYTSGEPFLQRTAIYEKGQVVDSKYYR